MNGSNDTILCIKIKATTTFQIAQWHWPMLYNHWSIFFILLNKYHNHKHKIYNICLYSLIYLINTVQNKTFKTVVCITYKKKLFIQKHKKLTVFVILNLKTVNYMFM